MRPHGRSDDQAAQWRSAFARETPRLRRHARGMARRLRLALEGLESRELPSMTLPTAAGVDQSQFPDPVVIQQSVNLLYGPNSATPMTPTPREVKRETFTARWIGQYTIGPPNFSDRASTIHAWAKSGGSNQFLKGKFQMEIFPPADPNAAPNPGNPFANRVTGLAALFPQNLLQTGGLLVLDLNGPPAPGSTTGELPTHLSWTYDTNSSAGPYTSPALFSQGTGALDIKWIPDTHPRSHTLGSGRMIVTFQGLINYNQIASAVSKAYS